MGSQTSNNNAVAREKLFRQFQVEKFGRSRSVPSVSMTIDIVLTRIQQRRRAYNSGAAEADRITLTHVLIKSVSMALVEFPDLYGLFNGSRVVPSKQIRINLPIAEGHHVEYLVIKSPESKGLQEIAREVREGTSKIRAGAGDFYLGLKTLFRFPRMVRRFVTHFMPLSVRLAYKSYGNFPITNFGSFGVKNGIPVLSTPMIGVLCVGMIQSVSTHPDGNGSELSEVLPVTLVFDHRPIDGAYGGQFLNRLKALMESEVDSVFA